MVKRKRHALAAPLILLGLLPGSLPVGAQSSSPPAVYAIVGVRIEVGDGRVIDKGTVVLRDGLIEAVGPNVTVPPDAEVIPGAGLVVYPGFMDAHATSGLKLPDSQPNQDVPPDTGVEAPPFMREANRKGVRPEVRAVDCLDLTDAALLPIRQNGFTTELLLPSGGMINGCGGLINLSGRPRRDCVVRPDVALDVAFTTGGPRGFGGGYPGSLMGVFAEIRQTLLDAQRYKLQQAAFAQGGGQRPPDDDTLAALQPVLDGRMPVLFDADSENEIIRAVHLADSFHLRPVISGGLYAFKQTDLLAKEHVPVLVSLNFGPEPGVKASPPGTAPSGAPGGGPGRFRRRRNQPPAATSPGDTQGEPTTPPSEQEPELRSHPAAPPEEDDDTPKAVIAERKRLWNEKVANAAKLNAAGVLFAFTTREIRNQSDFWDDLRRAIKAGLPRDAALRALTINPARIFDVDKQMGTVEPGKIAAVTVMTGDFVDPQSKVKYLFIDRWKFEPEKDKAPTPTPPTRLPRPGDDDEDR